MAKLNDIIGVNRTLLTCAAILYGKYNTQIYNKISVNDKIKNCYLLENTLNGNLITINASVKIILKSTSSKQCFRVLSYLKQKFNNSPYLNS